MGLINDLDGKMRASLFMLAEVNERAEQIVIFFFWVIASY